MLYFHSFQHRRPAIERNDRYMPAYYNEDTKKWYCKFYYKDWQGNRKQKKKSGFERKKDALEWERSFLDKLAGSPDMAFSDMVELYFEDKEKHIKRRTYLTQKNIFKNWIFPYFQNKSISSITPMDIRKWQGILKESRTSTGVLLSSSYIKSINGSLSSVFNFAIRFYGFHKNPCHVAGSIKAAPKNKNVDFWTKEEFDRFINTFDKSDPYYIAFVTLYYTGMRIGELQALTLSDLDLENGIIHITKTFAIVEGKQVITAPKTLKSIRDILIPNSLCRLLQDYKRRFYKPLPGTRLFQAAHNSYRYQLIKHSIDAGVKRIRLHDLRHSHASLLIDLGFNILLISERLGHEDPSITLKIYAHLFPSKQGELVERLEYLFKENEIK